MVNLKRKVSHSDFLDCYNYFDRSIRNNRFMNEIERQDTRVNAIESFSKIKTNEASDINVLSLQLWVDQFVDPEAWSKCYRNLNQKKYLAQSNNRSIQVTESAHSALKSYATNNHLTLSEAIVSLLETSNQSHKSLASTELNKKHDFNLVFEESVKRGHEYIQSLIQSKDLNSKKKSTDDESRENKCYREYRDRIKRLTIKKPDETVLEYFERYFEKPLGYYLMNDNIIHVSQHLFNLRQQLLNDNLLLNEFIPSDFSISKTLIIPQHSMDGFGEELCYVLSHIFGCDTTHITSGSKEPLVFTGNTKHVQLAYKTFNYISAYLREEEEAAFNNCHKNMKRTNRYSTAGWHCTTLLHKMFPNNLDDEINFKLLPETEEKKLVEHTLFKVGLHYDIY